MGAIELGSLSDSSNVQSMVSVPLTMLAEGCAVRSSILRTGQRRAGGGDFRMGKVRRDICTFCLSSLPPAQSVDEPPLEGSARMYRTCKDARWTGQMGNEQVFRRNARVLPSWCGSRLFRGTCNRSASAKHLLDPSPSNLEDARLRDLCLSNCHSRRS